MRYSVKNLKEAGFKVDVNHHRYQTKVNGDQFNGNIRPLKQFYDIWGHADYVHPCGGFTEVVLETPYGEELRGYANCRNDEQYNRKFGTKIAIAAALKSGGLAYQHNRVIYFRNPEVDASKGTWCSYYGKSTRTCRQCNPELWIKVKL